MHSNRAATQFGFYDDRRIKYLVVTVAGLEFWIIKIKEMPVNFLLQFSYRFLTYLIRILDIMEPYFYTGKTNNRNSRKYILTVHFYLKNPIGYGY